MCKEERTVNQETNVQEKEARVRQPWTAQRVGDILLNNALLIIMAIAVVYIAIKNPNFIKPASLINILSQTAAYLPAALGIGGCIVLTGTDLSAGRAVGITACISASLLQNAANMANKMWPQIGTLPIPVVIVLAMLIGAAIGCFNGFFVAKFKLHPFIVTLGTQLILYTVLLLYVQQGNNKGMAISNLDPSYTGFVKGSLFSIGGTPIPNYVLFAIVLTAVMWFVWNKTTFGKNMFALGSNEEAARVSGVNVFATTIAVFALAGAMYGWAGFVESARIASNTANTGVNYELDVSKEPGHRIKNLKWPNGKAVKDTDTFVVAVNNYRATTQLLTAADIFLPGEDLPKLLEIDVRGDVGGIRELLGEYIRTVKGGTIEPHVNNNWKIVGNNWKAADHQKAVQLLREGKLALNENADARTLPGKAITTADIAKF